MKTRFSKKFLACVLSVCMILTVCAGALTVSAAVAGTATIGTAEIATTDTQAVVPVTLTADAAIGGADLFITVPADADITVVDIKTAGYDLTYASGTEDVTATAGTAATATVNETDGVAQFVLLGNGEFDAVATTVEIELTFTGTFAEGTHAVAFADGTLLGTAGDETAINAALTNGAIVATVAHTHNYVAVVTPPTCTEDGYTTYTCDCNDTYTEAGEPATGHAYGKPVDNGDGTHTATCANDPAHTVTNVHSYVDGTCECDAKEPVSGPVVDPSLVFQGASLGIGDNSLEMTFRIRKTVLELYNEVKVVIIPQKYDASLNLIDPPVEKVIGSAELENANTSGSIKKYVYTDFELYELGLNFDYMLRAYDENGNLVAQSEVYGTSAAEFLKSLYTTTSSETMKTLITDTLIVGEEAIKRMKATYPNASIANAASVIEGFDTSKATASVGTPNSIDEIDCKDEEYTFGGATATYPHALRRSAAVGKAPYLSYRIYNKGGTALDISKLSVRVSFDKYDGTQFNQTFTSADGVITHTGTGNWTNVTLSCIPMPDSNKDITIEISYDGDIKTVMTYSIETYLNSVSQDSDLYDLAVALIKLGVGFRNQKASS